MLGLGTGAPKSDRRVGSGPAGGAVASTGDRYRPPGGQTGRRPPGDRSAASGGAVAARGRRGGKGRPPAEASPATGHPVTGDRWPRDRRPVAEAGGDRSAASGRPVAGGEATGLATRRPVPVAGSGGPVAGTGDRPAGRSTSYSPVRFWRTGS